MRVVVNVEVLMKIESIWFIRKKERCGMMGFWRGIKASVASGCDDGRNYMIIVKFVDMNKCLKTSWQKFKVSLFLFHTKEMSYF